MGRFGRLRLRVLFLQSLGEDLLNPCGWGFALDLHGDGPDEADEFAGDGSDGDDALLAVAEEVLEAGTEADLGFPGDFDHGLGLAVLAFSDVGRDPGRKPVLPGGFDHGPATTLVAGPGDGALTALLAGGGFAGNDADEGHQAGGLGEAGEVADLGHPGDGMEGGEAPQAHQGLDQGTTPPPGQLGVDGGGEAFNAADRILNGTEQFLEGDLLAGMRELLDAQVVEMAGGPTALAVVAASVAEEEALDALTAGAEFLDGAEPGADQVPHGLVGLVRHMDEGEFAGPEQAREVAGVAAVGLDAIAGLLGNLGRRDHTDGDPLGGEVAREPEAGRPGLVDVTDLGTVGRKLGVQTVEGVGRGRDGAVDSNRFDALGDANGKGFSMDIEGDVFDGCGCGGWGFHGISGDLFSALF